MPANSYDFYHMQDARNNFDAMRPAPICTDANQIIMGQKIHISTNCYYGYHDQKRTEVVPAAVDYEMSEDQNNKGAPPPQCSSRKRSADDTEYPQNKRIRQEVQREKNKEPETNENIINKKPDTSTEEILELLYWNIHGGNYFHLLQCS